MMLKWLSASSDQRHLIRICNTLEPGLRSVNFKARLSHLAWNSTERKGGDVSGDSRDFRKTITQRSMQPNAREPVTWVKSGHLFRRLTTFEFSKFRHKLYKSSFKSLFTLKAFKLTSIFSNSELSISSTNPGGESGCKSSSSSISDNFKTVFEQQRIVCQHTVLSLSFPLPEMSSSGSGKL